MANTCIRYIKYKYIVPLFYWIPTSPSAGDGVGVVQFVIAGSGDKWGYDLMNDNVQPERLSIYCLDGFKVYRGRALIPSQKWQRQKVALLFKYLLVANRPVPRHELISEFWPHLEEPAARHNLAVTLYNLRRTLWPQRTGGKVPFYIKSDASYIKLNRSSIAFYDVRAFNAFRIEGLGAYIQGLWDQAVAALIAANNLYKNDFLADTIGEIWIQEERAQLKKSRLDLLEHLTEVLIKLGRHREAYPYAETMVQLDPCREEGHRMLMKILINLGHRSQAIAQYQQCKKILQRELGIQPGSKTNNLYHQIISGES